MLCSIGIRHSFLNRLQAVINAAARLICSAKKSEHITPILMDLHWLRIQERIQYKHCTVQVFKCKHSLAPAYLSEQLQQVAQLESRQCLRSSSLSAFVVPATRRSRLGDRSFSAAGTRAWNSLPPTVTAASTLSSFRRYLKSHLFTKSFPS